MKSNYRFWIFYTAAWLLYAASLGAVFVGVGNQFGFPLLLQIFCNVAPAFLLGIGVVFLCRKLSWSRRQTALFISIHLICWVLYSFLWIFLTLFDLSVLNYLNKGIWTFVVWDKYGSQWQIFTGLMAYLTIASSVYVGETNANLQLETRRNAELELRAVRAEAARNQAELVALRSQLNPHFLFNTLHSLMALVRTDAGKAEEAIERFALMLRYVLQSQAENRSNETDVTFADEWRFVQNYLELEKLRLGERLKIETNVEDESLNFKMPAFTVQPMIENAIKHAIAPNKNGGTINIAAHVSDGKLNVEISDSGRSASVEKTASSDGLGLRLVRESLAARFGGEAEFNYQITPEKSFKVSVIIPKTIGSGGNTK